MDSFAVLIIFLSSLGFLISLYAFVVKQKLGKNKNYRPLCDVNEYVSCTKALKTSYGSLFLVPNSVWGMVFYLAMIVFSFLDQIMIVFWLSLAFVIGSLYLAYISFFKLKIICPLCLGIYVVNGGIFLLSAFLAF